MPARIYSALVILVLTGLAVGIAQLEIDKSKLRRQLVPLRQSEASLTRLRTESARDRTLLTQFKTSSDAGAKAIHAELVAARAELSVLEAKAAGSRADAAATPSIEGNRDPMKAMTRLEFLSDAGRATPEAAFQTLVWAAMKGREPELAACFALDQPARAMAESFIATLSAEARVKYTTPEQLVGLAFSHSVLEATAVQFVAEPIADRDHATVALRVRVNGRERESKIPLVRSAGGWSVAIGEKQVEAILRGLAGEQPAPPLPTQPPR